MKLFYNAETGEPTHTLDTEDPDILQRQTGAYIEVEDTDFDLLGIMVEDGQVVPLPPKPHPTSEYDYLQKVWVETRTLNQIKSDALEKLRFWIEEQRRSFVTVLPGQEMIYLAKEAEAHRFLADPDPDLAQYPFIQKEIGITAPTAYEIAQIWAWMAEFWRAAAADLEQARLGLAMQIQAAATKETVEAIVSGL